MTTLHGSCVNITKAFNNLKNSIWLVISRPFITYLAFEDSLNQIRSLLSPQMKEVENIRTLSRSLKRSYRGVFLEYIKLYAARGLNASDAVKSSYDATLWLMDKHRKEDQNANR